MFSTAFKQQIDMFPSKKYIPFLQFTPKLDAFQYIFTDFSRQMINAYENSIIAAVGSAFLATAIGAMAGYALVRFNYKFLWMKTSDDVAFWFVSQRMLPPVVVVFPFILMYHFAGILDSVGGLVIAYTLFNLPLAVWITRDAFRRCAARDRRERLHRRLLEVRLVLPHLDSAGDAWPGGLAADLLHLCLE